MAGKTACAAGMVACDSTPYLIPQHFGQYDSMTVAEALGVAEKLAAMEAILGGQGTEHDFTLLNDEWDIEDRLAEAFADGTSTACRPALRWENSAEAKRPKRSWPG